MAVFVFILQHMIYRQYGDHEMMRFIRNLYVVHYIEQHLNFYKIIILKVGTRLLQVVVQCGEYEDVASFRAHSSSHGEG